MSVFSQVKKMVCIKIATETTLHQKQNDAKYSKYRQHTTFNNEQTSCYIASYRPRNDDEKIQFRGAKKACFMYIAKMKNKHDIQ